MPWSVTQHEELEQIETEKEKLSMLMCLADRVVIIKKHLFSRPGQVLQTEHGLMKVSSG